MNQNGIQDQSIDASFQKHFYRDLAILILLCITALLLWALAYLINQHVQNYTAAFLERPVKNYNFLTRSNYPCGINLARFLMQHQKNSLDEFEAQAINYTCRHYLLTTPASYSLLGTQIMKHNNKSFIMTIKFRDRKSPERWELYGSTIKRQLDNINENYLKNTH